MKEKLMKEKHRPGDEITLSLPDIVGFGEGWEEIHIDLATDRRISITARMIVIVEMILENARFDFEIGEPRQKLPTQPKVEAKRLGVSLAKYLSAREEAIRAGYFWITTDGIIRMTPMRGLKGAQGG